MEGRGSQESGPKDCMADLTIACRMLRFSDSHNCGFIFQNIFYADSLSIGKTFLAGCGGGDAGSRGNSRSGVLFFPSSQFGAVACWLKAHWNIHDLF